MTSSRLLRQLDAKKTTLLRFYRQSVEDEANTNVLLCLSKAFGICRLITLSTTLPSEMAPKSAKATTTTAVQSLWKAYNDNTPDRLKFIDSFLLFLMLSGIIQFLYCVLVSNFPYNAFLSGCVVSCKLNRSAYRPCSPVGLEAQLDNSC